MYPYFYVELTQNLQKEVDRLKNLLELVLEDTNDSESLEVNRSTLNKVKKELKTK